MFVYKELTSIVTKISLSKRTPLSFSASRILKKWGGIFQIRRNFFHKLFDIMVHIFWEVFCNWTISTHYWAPRGDGILGVRFVNFKYLIKTTRTFLVWIKGFIILLWLIIIIISIIIMFLILLSILTLSDPGIGILVKTGGGY